MTAPISIPEAEALLTAVFANSGVPPVAALSVARALVAAEAEGQAGHGFSRVADYAAQARSGKVVAGAVPRLTAPAPAALHVDAGCGFAYPALDVGIPALIRLAQKTGIAVLTIGNSHHCGALSVQVERVAEAGLIGLMVANTPKAIAPHGGSKAVFGTNPIAFATPLADAPPLVIDLSVSTVARGKVMAAAKAGQPIPEGWALDGAGQPTTDPDAALKGTMLPIGGAKGTALALMVELLAAALTGSAFSAEAPSFFSGEGPPPRVGQTLIAIRPGATDYAARAAQLCAAIAAQEGARLPGTRRRAARAQAQADGLRVPAHLLAAARALAAPD